MTFAACGRRTYPLLQCCMVWYTELNNLEFAEDIVGEHWVSLTQEL